MALITDFEINDTITSISSNAFNGLNSLECIELPFIGYKIDSTNTFNYILGTVPSTLVSVKVTKDETIPTNAFKDCSSIESITIPTTTKTIGSYAFYNCTSLEKLNSNTVGEINIPTAVWTISSYVFYGCQSITEITLSKDVTSIGEGAFYGCTNVERFNSNTDYTLVTPKCCESIGQYAFRNMSLITDVVINDTVTSIGNGALRGLNSLESITLPFVGSSLNDTNSYTMTFGHIFGYYNSSNGGKTSNTSYSYTYQGYYYSFYIPTT